MLGALVFAASAHAIANPEQYMGGAGSKWFSGSLIQELGENCIILGESYTEVMVSGIGSYGGAPGGGVVKVGDAYWVSLLVAIPGNPCGSGSSSVVTNLVLPRKTSFDGTRQIRCFGTPRFSSDFLDLTNENWNAFGHSGRYCPTGPNNSAPIGQNYGFRPLANGQMFWIFVPVKTTGTLQGAGSNDEFNWLTYSSAAYASPGRSSMWANVFAANTSTQAPYIYFASEPAAIPYWCATCSAGTENRVEFWVNAFTGGHGGHLGYEIRRRDNNALLATNTNDPGYNGTVPAGLDLVQVLADGDDKGPNGGYVPFFFGPDLANVPMKITWDFTYNGNQHATGTVNFRTLSGANDCRNAEDPPASCLGKVPKVKGGAAVKKNAKLKKAKLSKGLPLGLTCNVASKAAAKLVVKGGGTVASGKAECIAAEGGELKLKFSKKGKKKAKSGAAATLTITFTRKGSPAFKFKRPVKIG